jgi:hypothetical protein
MRGYWQRAVDVLNVGCALVCVGLLALIVVKAEALLRGNVLAAEISAPRVVP